MKPNSKFTVVATLALGLLAGCSTTGVSTHGNSIDHSTNRSMHDDRSNPLTGSVRSLKGDSSRQFVIDGQKHFKAQNYGLAEVSFRKAVEARSDNAGAWLGLAASYDQLGRFDFSDRAYEQLAELKGNNARVLNNMGYSQLLRGDYQKARGYLLRAQTIDPGLEEIQGNIHLLEKTING